MAAQICGSSQTCSCANYTLVTPSSRKNSLPMRILFCNKYNYPFSGTEVYLFELMQLLRSQGHEVALFSMEDSRGERTPYDGYFVPHIDFKSKAGFAQKVQNAAHAMY